MLLVGLTGGIGSGKSTVAGRMAELGAVVIDADVVAREVVEPGRPAYDDIVAHFGPGVVAADGTLDRPALAAVVFADAQQLAVLNRLTHPRVSEEIAARLAAVAEPDALVVIDVALLIEGGQERGYQAVVVVATDPGIQLVRLVRLRGMPEAEARARIAAQAPLAAKLARATHVIWNEGTLAQLLARTDEVVAELRAMAAPPPA